MVNLHTLEKKFTGRDKSLFNQDLVAHSSDIKKIVENSSFLVLGGAGSIGQSVVKEIFSRNPKKLHVIDLNENNLTELSRDLRSSLGYIDGEYKTFCIDIGLQTFEAYFNTEGSFDYVLNLTAMKHVRSEKDPYSLARMIDINIFNTIKTIKLCISKGVKKYFCVSTDKAANPVNLMGASKRIMELFLMRDKKNISISTARFANVAFSDGSLPFSFVKRIEKNQPLSVPNDIKRFFVSHREAGELCLMSCIYGKNMEIYFPKLDENNNAINFIDLAHEFLREEGLKPIICHCETKARELMKTINTKDEWPLLCSETNTSGEKPIEEFYSANERIELSHYNGIGIVYPDLRHEIKKLESFEKKFKIQAITSSYKKNFIVSEMKKLVPNFLHLEKDKSLDEKM